MRRSISILALLPFLLGPLSAWGGDRVLIKNNSHIVSARYGNDKVTLVLEAVRDRTNNLRGTFPNIDFVSIRADVNQNGKIDKDIDVSYGVKSGSVDQLCTQLLIAEGRSKACGSFKSKASVKASFKKTANSSVAHPVWEFTIPVRELSRNSKLAHLVLRFHEAGPGYTRYPTTKKANVTFSKVQMVSLTARSFAVRSKPLKTQRPAISRLDKRVLKGSLAKLAPRPLIKNDRHVVSAKKSGDKIIFILEAVRDTTNNLRGKFPRLDFSGMRVDVNQNGKIDENIDVAFGIAGGSSDRICTQYLISESRSKGCGSFKSRATLKVEFKATINAKVPHPVWQFTIPSKELGRGSTSANLVFRFHEAGKGYTRYPDTPSANVTFSRVTALNLSSLTVAKDESDVEVDDVAEENVSEPEIVETLSNDTEPPIVRLMHPDVEPEARVQYQSGTIEIRGQAEDESGIFEVLINGEEAEVSGNGKFSRELRLAYGINRVSVKVTDIKDNWTQSDFTIERESSGASPDDRGVSVVPESTMTGADLGTYYALLIAVQEYENPDINDLDQPVSDASKLKDVLIQDYNFEASNVSVLENPGEEEILQRLTQLRGSVTEHDNLLIFYAGHGLYDEQIEQGYWLPSDAKQSSNAKWISNGDIRDALKGIQSKHTLLISDACFSGGLFRTRDAFSGVDQAIDRLHSLSSRKAMTSGTLTQVPDRSVFLEYLTKRLRDNTEQWLTANHLFASFRKSVMDNSENIPQYGVIHKAGDEGGEFIFVRRN